MPVVLTAYSPHSFEPKTSVSAPRIVAQDCILESYFMSPRGNRVSLAEAGTNSNAKVHSGEKHTALAFRYAKL